MIDEHRRKEIYTSAFQFMIDNDISTIPVWTEDICIKLNIQLAGLSDIIRDTGMSKEAVFAIWGNEDGVMQSHGTVCKISYNDTMPLLRRRFTIMEEIAHMWLGHIKDKRFNIFNQEYDEATYNRYEEEARTWAGLVLCPPQYFYCYNSKMTSFFFQNIYNVSSGCAKARMGILCKFESEIKECELYKRLPHVALDQHYIKSLFPFKKAT